MSINPIPLAVAREVISEENPFFAKYKKSFEDFMETAGIEFLNEADYERLLVVFMAGDTKGRNT